MIRRILAGLFLALWATGAHAAICSTTLPFTLTNGSVADASQVMANYNAIIACVNSGAATSGVNTNITALSGLTTPLTPTQGGTNVFQGTGVGGSANAITVSTAIPNSFSLSTFNVISFMPIANNTGATTLQVGALAATPIMKQGSSGPAALTGGEIVSGQLTTVIYDGAEFLILNNASVFVSPAFVGTPTAPSQTYTDTSTAIATDFFVHQVAQTTVIPWGIAGGLPTSFTATTNANAAITVSQFSGVDQTGSIMLNWAGTKSWAVSNGNAINGYAGGTTLPNSSTIHVYACSGGTGIGTYATTTAPGTFVASSCPTGYNTFARRLFSFTTNGSGVAQTYVATEIMGGGYRASLASQPTDINNNLNTVSRTLFALTIPTGVKVIARIMANCGNANNYSIYLTSPDEPDGTTTSLNCVTTYSPYQAFNILTDTSARIGARGQSALNLTENTQGWDDPRRT